MRQLGLEGVAVLGGREVAALAAPVGDRAGDAADHLPDRALARGRVELAAEVLLGDDVRRVLRPGSSGTRRPSARRRPCRRGRSARRAAPTRRASNGWTPGVVKKRCRRSASPAGASIVVGVCELFVHACLLLRLPAISAPFDALERSPRRGRVLSRRRRTDLKVACKSALLRPVLRDRPLASSVVARRYHRAAHASPRRSSLAARARGAAAAAGAGARRPGLRQGRGRLRAGAAASSTRARSRRRELKAAVRGIPPEISNVVPALRRAMVEASPRTSAATAEAVKPAEGTTGGALAGRAPRPRRRRPRRPPVTTRAARDRADAAADRHGARRRRRAAPPARTTPPSGDEPRDERDRTPLLSRSSPPARCCCSRCCRGAGRACAAGIPPGSRARATAGARPASARRAPGRSSPTGCGSAADGGAGGADAAARVCFTPRPMKLLVTGGAGYIGSIVAQQLLDAGHDVVVLDNLSAATARPCRTARGSLEVDLLDADARRGRGRRGLRRRAALRRLRARRRVGRAARALLPQQRRRLAQPARRAARGGREAARLLLHLRGLRRARGRADGRDDADAARSTPTAPRSSRSTG